MSKIGCHVSIAGGIVNAPKNAADLGCEVFQMFSRSPRGGAAQKIDAEIAQKFKEEVKAWKQADCYIHAPYYINFASSKKTIRDASIRICREEIERGSLIGVKCVMAHMGSSGEFTRDEALKMVASGVKSVMEGYKGTTQFLMEISAGAGNVIGDTFDELSFILDHAGPAGKKIGICLDSAHMFASGYDIKTKDGFDSTMKVIENTIGTDKIKVIHANDSKVGLGEHKDRHDHIGDGKIGEAGFINLFKAFPGVDFILETEHDKVKQDIIKLKKLRK